MDQAAASVMPLLRRGVNAGLWTVEQLDKPSAGWLENMTCKVADYPKGPTREVPYYGKEHRNLLRDHHPETVQAGPSPRDFTPPSDPQPDVRPTSSPVHLAGEEDPGISDECDLF